MEGRTKASLSMASRAGLSSGSYIHGRLRLGPGCHWPASSLTGSESALTPMRKMASAMDGSVSFWFMSQPSECQRHAHASHSSAQTPPCASTYHCAIR